MCGYTQSELESNFAEYLDSEEFLSMEDDDGNILGRETGLELLKYWYDGFCFCDGEETLYNPVSVGQFFVNRCRFRNYWFSTGTPSFLIDIVRKNHMLTGDLNGALISDSSFNVFDIAELSGRDIRDERIVQLMLQAGYLTIDKVVRKRPQYIYSLRFPNYEVELSFTESLISEYYSNDKPLSYANEIVTCAENGRTGEMIEWFEEFFANMPYDIRIKDEKYYQSMVYAVFKLCGMDIIAEECTNVGRIDAVLDTAAHMYIIEFKLNKTAGEAIEQIDDRKYSQKYLYSAKKRCKCVHKLGINFVYAEGYRNINDWKEEIEQPAMDL